MEAESWKLGVEVESWDFGVGSLEFGVRGLELRVGSWKSRVGSWEWGMCLPESYKFFMNPGFSLGKLG